MHPVTRVSPRLRGRMLAPIILLAPTIVCLFGASLAPAQDAVRVAPRAKNEFTSLEQIREDAASYRDFQIQGEYAGTIDGEPWGAQIVASPRGVGEFDGVGFPGGLPGAGWRVEDGRRLAKGSTRDDVTTFESEDARSVIEGKKLVVYSKDGDRLGALERVERRSASEGEKPPAAAVVLFGKPEDVEKWSADRDGKKPAKTQNDGWLERGVFSRATFQSGLLHLEFRTPFAPAHSGQGRGNSGCYLQGRYEVQILDSFGLEAEMGDCGGIYSIAKPRLNMCYPPLAWQTYDIEFTAARYDTSGKQIQPPRMSVWHNGVLIHERQEIRDRPKGTTAAPIHEGPDAGPVFFQHHGNYVVYRNIWFLPRD